MKLKTELHQGKLGFFDINTVYHDAAYAHALVMALPDGSLKDSVVRMADELMREWGYES